MYKTKEIRWFFKNNNEQISKWFRTKELTFKNVAPRTDFYLPLGIDSIGFKLREGRIEIKHRLAGPDKGKLTPSLEGYFENWIKWSFDSNNDDPIYNAITKSNAYDWLKVSKTRLGLKYTRKNGKLEMAPIVEELLFGCQVEYTQVTYREEKWYTFGLEWFGEQYLKVSPSLVSEIVGNSKLGLQESMGYAAFLDLNRRQS